ncbi:MAG: hypothetical protein NZ951_06100 [Dehalococcoidia bacterium]|nr:hypothetical protein [Dehalococcoidia bacterium]MDW8119963.1 hypothetical protein [Chloroflexota bacterium]
MRVHMHVERPVFLCVESSLWGWVISHECRPDRVEPCSENVVGDTVILPYVEDLLAELRRRGVSEGDVARVWAAAQGTGA